MSGIMKFWAISGMILWVGILACCGAVVSQRIAETIARRRREEE